MKKYNKFELTFFQRSTPSRSDNIIAIFEPPYEMGVPEVGSYFHHTLKSGIELKIKDADELFVYNPSGNNLLLIGITPIDDINNIPIYEEGMGGRYYKDTGHFIDYNNNVYRMKEEFTDFEKFYSDFIEKAFRLYQDKNHDYGDAWKQNRPSTLTDKMLDKLFRIRHIEENNGETRISEGILSELTDILNYAIMRAYRERDNDDN